MAAPNRILRAADFQQPDDPAVQLASRRESQITTAVKAGLSALVTAVKSVPLSHMLSTASVVAAVSSNNVNDALLASYKPVAKTFLDAAEGEAKAKFQNLVVYDPAYAAGQIAGAQQTFIGAIQGQASDVVQAQLIDAVRNGANAADVAKALQSVIGLNRPQAQAVMNFRRLLERGDRTVLSRALRDQRFDRTVINAITSGSRLTEDQIDAMVERYATRTLAFRAETIAHDQSLSAATGGIRDAYVQAVQTGRLKDSEVTRKWQLDLDERTCPVCISIPILNPNGVGVMQPYLSIQGLVMAPGVHPRCRCTESYKADLTRIASSPFAQAA